MERKHILEKVVRKQGQIRILNNKIAAINQEILELRRKDALLSDEIQWYKETTETVGRGKNKKQQLVGRIHWKEDFKDDDTGQITTIERCRAVRIDGEWL